MKQVAEVAVDVTREPPPNLFFVIANWRGALKEVVSNIIKYLNVPRAGSSPNAIFLQSFVILKSLTRFAPFGARLAARLTTRGFRGAT